MLTLPPPSLTEYAGRLRKTVPPRSASTIVSAADASPSEAPLVGLLRVSATTASPVTRPSRPVGTRNVADVLVAGMVTVPDTVVNAAGDAADVGAVVVVAV